MKILFHPFTINKSINQSTNQPINQSINQSTNQPINQSTNKEAAADSLRLQIRKQLIELPLILSNSLKQIRKLHNWYFRQLSPHFVPKEMASRHNFQNGRVF